MKFYNVVIPKQILANLALEAETREIGIEAGLQDRVCQVYAGLVFMDFEKTHMETHGHGKYEPIDPFLLPPLYLAYEKAVNQASGIYHSRLRERWERGDAGVAEAMRVFADLAERGEKALLDRDHRTLAALMDHNFDTRSKLVKLRPSNAQMVSLARHLGVCAKYAGSGGAIVGVCECEEQFSTLEREFSKIGCIMIRPRVL